MRQHEKLFIGKGKVIIITTVNKVWKGNLQWMSSSFHSPLATQWNTPSMLMSHVTVFTWQYEFVESHKKGNHKGHSKTQHGS